MSTRAAEIPLEQIAPNPEQPRTVFAPDELEELAASIRVHGVLQPIVVSRIEGGYELVAGHRRVLAAHMAGRTSVPAVIRGEVSDRLELALIENVQRADLNPIEEATAYRTLMDTYRLTQEQLAERIGRSPAVIANAMRMLSAPRVVQEALIAGRISEGHVRALLPLRASQIIAALGEVLACELSVHATEALTRRLAARAVRDDRALRDVEPELRTRTAALSAALGTKVRIERRRSGGRIALDFYSDEDLERLCEMLIGAARRRPAP